MQQFLKAVPALARARVVAAELLDELFAAGAAVASFDPRLATGTPYAAC